MIAHEHALDDVAIPQGEEVFFRPIQRGNQSLAYAGSLGGGVGLELFPQGLPDVGHALKVQALLQKAIYLLIAPLNGHTKYVVGIV